MKNLFGATRARETEANQTRLHNALYASYFYRLTSKWQIFQIARRIYRFEAKVVHKRVHPVSITFLYQSSLNSYTRAHA